MHQIILGYAPNDIPVVATLEFGTFFGRGTFSATENVRTLVVPRGMTVHDLFISSTNAQATLPMEVILRIGDDADNMADTALTVTIATGAILSSNTTTRVHINAGQTITLSFDSPATSTAAAILSYAMIGDLDG